MRPGASLAG